MPFCESCGAQVSGAFCTHCGARSEAGEPAPASPTIPAPAVAAPRKTSPLLWILVAILGLFLAGGIAVVGAGIFFAHKAGIDPDLMRSNPALATARMMAATNPDLEVVSSDNEGRVTIRQRSTGKVVTMNFDELKRGKITFKETGKDSVTFETHGDGQNGSVDIKTGNESVSFGTNQAKLPAWMPAYPHSAPQGNFSASGKEGSTANFQFQTGDAAKDVVAFYERELKQAGFRITSSTVGDSGSSSGGVLSAEDDANKRSVMVTVGSGTVNLTIQQK